MAKKRSLKSLAKSRARAELREIKARIKESKNPFSKILAFVDRVPNLIDTFINVGLAIQSLQVFSTEELVRVQKQVRVPAIPDPMVELPARTYTVTEYEKQRKYHWETALYGPIAYKLARSNNVVAGAAGVAALVALGVAPLIPQLEFNILDLEKLKRHPAVPSTLPKGFPFGTFPLRR